MPAREAREAAQAYKIGVLNRETGFRIDFVRSITSGVPVVQYAPHSQAARAIESLCEEIV